MPVVPENIDFSGLPDKQIVPPVEPGGIDFAGLPDKEVSPDVPTLLPEWEDIELPKFAKDKETSIKDAYALAAIYNTDPSKVFQNIDKFKEEIDKSHVEDSPLGLKLTDRLTNIFKPVPALAWSGIVEAGAGAAGLVGMEDRAARWRDDVNIVRNQVMLENPLERGSWSEATRNAFVSIYTQAPAYGLGLLLKGRAAALALMGGVAGLQKSSELQEGGFGKGTAFVGGAISGISEAATELIPFGAFMDIMKKSPGVGKSLVKFFIGEQVGEQINTVVDSVIDKVTIRPDMTWDEYLQRVESTAKATLIQTGAMGAGSGAFRYAVERGEEKELIETLPEDVKETFDNAKAEAKANGMEEMKATMTALDAAAETTEGATHIENVVDEMKAREEGEVPEAVIPTLEETFERITGEDLTEEELGEMIETFAAGRELVVEEIVSAPVTEIKQRLVDVGMSEEEAQSNAALYDGFRVMAQRAGVSVDEIMERYLPELTREVAEVPTEDMEQVVEGIARGRIRIAPEGVNIELLKTADQSTFIHETGHLYFRMMKDLSGLETASDELKADFETIRDWMGVSEVAKEITVEQQEQFARGFEAYLREGKAPTSALAEAFENFKQWLMEIYRSLRELNVTLTPEVTEVFDRMLADEGVEGVEIPTEEVLEQPPIQSLQEIKKSAQEQDISVALSEDADRIALDKIVVPKDERSKGIGSSIIQSIVDYADANNKIVALTPTTDFGGTSVARLKRFYKQFGFMENKGRNKDFRFRETMLRRPQEEVLEQAPAPQSFQPRDVTQADLTDSVAGEKITNHLDGTGKYYNSTGKDLQTYLDTHGDGFLYRIADKRGITGIGEDRVDGGNPEYLHIFKEGNEQKTIALSSSLEDTKKELDNRKQDGTLDNNTIVYRILPEDISNEFAIQIPSYKEAGQELLHVHAPALPKVATDAELIFSSGQFQEEVLTDDGRRIFRQQRESARRERTSALRLRPGVRPEGRRGIAREEVLEQPAKISKKKAPPKVPVKKRVREITGQIKDPEMKELREEFIRKARTAREAFKAGKEAVADKETRKLKNILARSRKVRIVRDYLNLSDADMKKLTVKNPLFMDQWEFKQFIDDLRVRAVELSENKLQKAMLINLIHEKDLSKVDNYRTVLGFPAITKMTTEQAIEFAKALDQFADGSTFLTVRQLQLIDRTELEGARTYDEAKAILSEKTGLSIEELSKISITEWTKFKWDTALAESDPFLNLLVRGVNEKLLEANIRSFDIETKVHKLAKKSEKSRARTFLEKIIPQDKLIFEYLETPHAEKDAVMANMTKEQIDLAHYMQEYFANALEYLIQVKGLEQGRANYITHVRRGMLENIKEEGLHTAIRSMFTAMQEDYAVFNIGTDQHILPLDKFFQYEMRRTGVIEPSENVINVFLHYVKTFEKMVSLNEIMPVMDIYAQSITPQIYTPKGLEFDKSIKNFVHDYINNKKGRRVTAAVIDKQGGVVDVLLRSGKTVTSFLDLGWNIFSGLAATGGEQIANYQMLGTVKFAKGNKRIATKKGKAILKKYAAVIGRSSWEGITAPGEDIVDRTMTSAFALFNEATRLANKQFLLGSITDAEYNSGEISSERMTEVLLDMGRFRVVPGTKSLVGSTSVGGTLTQYKTWAIPVLRTNLKNLIDTGKNLKDMPVGEALTQREAIEIYRLVGLTLTAYIVWAMVGADEEDDSFVGQLLNKVKRETFTLIQAVDPTLFFGDPRLSSFLQQLAKNIKMSLFLEEYKTKPGLKGIEGFKRQLTPRAIKQFQKPKEKKERLR
jgi:GNAT superfamily N-acetyltransferase